MRLGTCRVHTMTGQALKEFSKMVFRVVSTHKEIPQAGVDILEKACVIIRPNSREELIEEASRADAIINFGNRLLYNEETIKKIKGPGSPLKIVANMGVGMDHIDVAALNKVGVKASNTSGSLDNSVAEIAIGLALSAGRRFKEGFEKIKRDQWGHNPLWLCGQDIYNSTFGIVGLGNIGRAIAKRVYAFEPSRILYSGNTQKSYASEFKGEFVPLETLLAESDFVCLICPLNDQTRNLINSKTLKMMKKNAILVNVARGGVVDQDALVDALKTGQIGGAGLDVMTPEPLPPDHPLVSLDNCVLSPHIGSASVATRNLMAAIAAKNIMAALLGQPLPNEVLP